MMEHSNILRKIENLIEKLPYKWVKIEIDLPHQTFVLEKEWRKTIGFEREE